MDISSTDSLLIPRGTRFERDSDTPGALRFNRDTSLCEVYTQSNIWSGLPVYKAEQPPAMTSISSTPSNQSVTVSWEKFANIYKDAYDGKCYPIFLQTFVDISFSDISGESTGGWKTIRIDNGNYDNNNTETTFLSSITFNSLTETDYSNTTGYSIDFTDKPDTDTNFDLPSFTQTDRFDLRVYAVNKSGTTPNYIYISGVGLKTTGAPGEVDVISFDNFSKTGFEIDVSFNLDASDADVTSGVDIEKYDISYVLVGSKSFYESRTDSGTLNLDSGSGPYDMSGISVTGLYPGAKYNIQVRAKNAANSDFGEYGDISTSTDFTNNGTNQYIDTADLNSVTHNGLNFSLENTTSIDCYVNESNSTRTIGNSTSYIDISGTSEFYVNYGLQGTDMSGVNDLVQATVELKKNNNSVSSQTITYNGTNNPSAVLANTIDISNGGSTFYKFSSAAGYNDKHTTDNYNNGFVYSSTFSRTDSNDLNSVFVDNFPASTDYYYLSYEIESQTNNQAEQIDKNGSTSATRNTGNFYVDDYDSTPTITWTQDPSLSVTGSTVLFGIPSVSSVNLEYGFDVSGFASNIIPNVGNVHSYVAEISKNSYSFDIQKKTGISTNNSYPITFDSSDSGITSQRYDDTTTSDVTVRVYYLDNTGTPDISYIDDNQKDVPDIGHIFKDSETSYTEFNLYTFNGSDAIDPSAINTYDSNFAATYSSDISSMLLRFNGLFVSGGYSATYNSTTITPFGNWSTSGGKYAVDGPDYSDLSNTGLNGFKWIAIDVSNKKSGNNVNLSTFKIGTILHSYKTFTTDYEAYILQNGVFGALNNEGTTNTAWFDDPQYNSNISDAKIRPRTYGGALQLDSDNGTIGVDAYVESSIATVYLIVGLPPDSSNYFTI